MTRHRRSKFIWGAALAVAGASLVLLSGAPEPAASALASATDPQPQDIVLPAEHPPPKTTATKSAAKTPASGAARTVPASASAEAPAMDPPKIAGSTYVMTPISADLQKSFIAKGFKHEPKSGNYLSPRIFAETPAEALVAVKIAGAFVSDERGNQVFLRRTLYDKLLEADAALFKDKKKHIIVGYGFRSNALQDALFRRLEGHAKVAQPGTSFHETGMAIDVINTRDSHKYLIKAGFQGGCDGIGEDRVHYSIGEITEASDFKTFRRCSVPGLFDHILFKKRS